MNDQFLKTLESVELAKTAMSDLKDTLEGLQNINAAHWSEVEAVEQYSKDLGRMINKIRSMLGQRENSLLEKLRANAQGC
jgi:hypothetical protein